jgi:hypothetical protein
MCDVLSVAQSIYVWPAGEELRIYLSRDEDLSHFLVGDSASERLGRSGGAAMHTTAYSASSLAESQSVVRTLTNRTSIFKWRSVVLSYIWATQNTQRQLAEAGDKIYSGPMFGHTRELRSICAQGSHDEDGSSASSESTVEW